MGVIYLEGGGPEGGPNLEVSLVRDWELETRLLTDVEADLEERRS